MTLQAPVTDWIARALGAPGIRLAPLSCEIALESCRLPGLPPADPADRIIVATARRHDAALATRDQKALEYGLACHLEIAEA